MIFMKVWFSLLGGLVIGIILSYFFLEYNGWTIHPMGENGEVVNTINELDFNLITNGFLIVFGVSFLIYVVWTLIERKKSDKSFFN